MRVRVFGVAFLAAALSGCWILNEIDEGSKKMDKYSAKKPESEVAAEEAAPVARKGPRVANTSRARRTRARSRPVASPAGS